MSLPVIHPLSETPLGRGPEGECLCNWCRHWSPLIKHLNAQLDQEGRRRLDELVTYYEHEQMDGEVDAARLAGDWPGWECMKGFHPDTHTVTPKPIQP